LAEGNYNAVGDLLRASHASLKDDLEVSCYELDIMSEAANIHPACIGARMTGGGFGGSCVAIVRESGVADFVAGVSAQYLAATGVEALIWPVSAARGAYATELTS
jgi:galactokinase